MVGQQPAYQELTDPANVNVLGTLTPRGWRHLNVMRVRSEVLGLDFDEASLRRRLLGETEDGEALPTVALVESAFETSGAMGGEHRKDLKEALIGAPVHAFGFGVPQASNVGDAEKPTAAPQAKRRF